MDPAGSRQRPREIRFLSVDPQDGRVVYAGGPEGIYRSQDRGDTWQRLGGGLGAQTMVIGPQDSRLLFEAGRRRALAHIFWHPDHGPLEPQYSVYAHWGTMWVCGQNGPVSGKRLEYQLLFWFLLI